MKNKNIIILILAAVGLSAIAYLTSHKNSPKPPAQMGKKLMQGINLDDIAKISMIATNGATTTIARSGDSWGVKETYNYPADFDRLRRAVVSLGDVKIERVLELSDRQKADMHISDKSPRIQFRDKDNKLLKEIWLGDLREGNAANAGPYGAMPTGRFISTDNGKTVIVVSETFYSFDNPSPKNWLDRKVCSLAAPDINSITVTRPNEPKIEIKRGTDNKLELTGLKPDEESVQNNLSSLENALSYMNIDDVASPKLDDKTIGLDKPIIYQAETKDHLLYEVKVGAKLKDGNNRYARISVKYIGPDKPSTPKDEKSDKKKKDDQQAAIKAEADKIAKAKQKAEELNKKLASWTYVIPSYIADNLTKKRSDLVKAKAKSSPKNVTGTPTKVVSVKPSKKTESPKQKTKTATKDTTKVKAEKKTTVPKTQKKEINSEKATQKTDQKATKTEQKVESKTTSDNKK